MTLLVISRFLLEPFGKTPMQTFLDAAPIAREKSIAA
jgi:hypothetical protein